MLLTIVPVHFRLLRIKSGHWCLDIYRSQVCIELRIRHSFDGSFRGSILILIFIDRIKLLLLWLLSIFFNILGLLFFELFLHFSLHQVLHLALPTD